MDQFLLDFFLFYETNSLIQCSRFFWYKLTSAQDVMKLYGHFLERTLNALFKTGRNLLPHPVLDTSKYSPHTHTQFLLKSTLILSSLVCNLLKVVCFPTTVLHISYECVTRYAHYPRFYYHKTFGAKYKLLSVADRASRLRAGWSLVRVPPGPKDFFLRKGEALTDAHAACYSMGTEVLSRE